MTLNECKDRLYVNGFREDDAKARRWKRMRWIREYPGGLYYWQTARIVSEFPKGWTIKFSGG